MVLNEGQLLVQGMGMSAFPIVFSPDNNSQAFPPPMPMVVMGDWACKLQIDKAGLLGGAVAICFTEAHEFMHHFQFRYWLQHGMGLPPPGTDTEMQADVLAGYWTGLRIRSAHPALSQALALASIVAAANMGDLALGSPLHHGTPNQRAELVRIGGAAGFGGAFGDMRAYVMNQDALMQWSMTVVRQVQTSVF
ncbi:MAG: hypothetical protein ABFE08_17255 [Armatimonadia bacterium]